MAANDGWFGSGSFRNLVASLEREETIDEYLEVIKLNLLRKENTIKELREQLKVARDEAYASDEMQKMKARLEEMRADYFRGFPISESESKMISEWKKNHDATEHANPKGYHGCSGGGYSYEFYPTAIGTSGVCVCDICRRKAYGAAFASGKYDREAYKKYMEEHKGEIEFQELG